MKLKSYAKSIVGGLAAGLTALYTAMADGLVTSQEAVGVALAVLAALGIVYAVPNKPAQ